jgi:hypothetical protein
MILEEAERRSDQISRAFDEAYRDREISETIVQKGHDYPLASLHEGEVLTRSLCYMHPMLAIA